MWDSGRSVSWAPCVALFAEGAAPQPGVWAWERRARARVCPHVLCSGPGMRVSWRRGGHPCGQGRAPCHTHTDRGLRKPVSLCVTGKSACPRAWWGSTCSAGLLDATGSEHGGGSACRCWSGALWDPQEGQPAQWPVGQGPPPYLGGVPGDRAFAFGGAQRPSPPSLRGQGEPLQEAWSDQARPLSTLLLPPPAPPPPASGQQLLLLGGCAWCWGRPAGGLGA